MQSCWVGPDCGEKWSYIKKPLYILTGCSGVGKTTTGMAIYFYFEKGEILENYFQNH